MFGKRRVFGFFLGLFSIQLASAAWFPGDIRQIGEEGLRFIGDFFAPFFEVLLNTSSYDDYFFAKILLFLLIFIVVFGVLKSLKFMGENKKVVGLVAFIISLLTIRYMPSEFIGGILLPYTALGIAITTIIPFMVYFWFVHKSTMGGTARRIAWIVYGVVFLLIWLTRPAETISSASHWLYIAGFAAIGASFFFDKNIHAYFDTAAAAKYSRQHKLKQIADIEAQLEKYGAITNPSEHTRSVLRELEHRHRELVREMGQI